MSDAKQGDNTPERPELNANRADGKPSGEGDTGHPKKRRRRWRKRKKQPSVGVQADSLNNVASGETRGDENARSAETGQERSAEVSINATSQFNAGAAGSKGDASRSDGLGKPRTGKRARRRRRRGKANATSNGAIGGQPLHTTADPSKSDADQARHSSPHQQRGRRQRHSPQTKEAAVRKTRHDAAVAGVENPTSKSANAKAGHTPNSRSRPADAYAALDLGTNNCRLLVAVPQQPGRFRVVDAFSRIVRLGEGLAASGRLSEQAMDRAVGALKACADKLENRNVKGVRLIATEACRQASNGKEFLERVEREAGLKLELIDRETEAKLAVAGCASLVDRKARGVVLFDIGGGSSELALLDLEKRQKHDLGPAMVSWMSLPLGVVTLSEKHGGGKLVTPAVFDAMVNEVSELLVNFEGKNALQEAAEQGEIHLLGTSGTVTTLAGIHLELPRYDRRQVDGTWMASRDIETMINKLVEMSFEERMSNPCIGRDRADLVLAGCAILMAIQRMWPCPRLRVADRGLREGLLTQMMNADNAWQRYPRRRSRR